MSERKGGEQGGGGVERPTAPRGCGKVPRFSKKGGDPGAPSGTPTLLRLRPSHQPHLWQLPPVRVRIPILGVASFHDVTGGVYNSRERIQRTVADARLLATPASCRRVAACNPN